MEGSLELLNRKNEENWVDKLEAEPGQPICMGHQFFAYKQEIVTLRETLQRHFNSVMLSIERGLPEVAQE